MTDHSECLYEIKYLRRRVDMAEAVIQAARRSISFDATKDDQINLVQWLGTYSRFLGERPDPARDASRQEHRAAAGLSTPLLEKSDG